MTRPNHGDVVDAPGGVREQVRHLNSAFSVLGELPSGAEQLRPFRHELILGFAELSRTRLSIEFVQQRFGIEGVDVGWATRHEQEDDAPGFRLKVRFPGCKGVEFTVFGTEQIDQRQRAEPAKRCGQELAAILNKRVVHGQFT